MQRLRQVKKTGNGRAVFFYKLDMKDFGIKEGDWVDISQIKKVEVVEWLKYF